MEWSAIGVKRSDNIDLDFGLWAVEVGPEGKLRLSGGDLHLSGPQGGRKPSGAATRQSNTLREGGGRR